MSQASNAIKQQRDYSNKSLMQQAQKGKTFDAMDRARYDQLAGRSAAPVSNTVSDTPNTSDTTMSNNSSSPTGSVETYNPSRTQAKEKAQAFNTQNVSQDNDQTSSVTGDNNYVYQSQDNSIRNYGGDNRTFTYNGGENPALDTPASAATMAGFFAPDDSHAANAARLDRQMTQNRDAQKQYKNTSSIAQGAISRAAQNSYIDPAALDKRVADRAQYSRAKATEMQSKIFGDMGNLQLGSWKDAKPAEKAEMPDYEALYEKYSDF